MIEIKHNESEYLFNYLMLFIGGDDSQEIKK